MIAATDVTASALAGALFSQTKLRVLSLLFGQPDRAFTMRELISLARSGSGAVQREIERLVAAGLATATVTGRQKQYGANRDGAIFEELRSIVQKLAGVPGVLRDALAPLSPRIHFAVLYGSVAKGSDRAGSDIDVLVVADALALEELYDALESAERRLGRRVSPTLYTSQEFLRRRRAGHAFLTKVLAGPHVVLHGSEDAFPPR